MAGRSKRVTTASVSCNWVAVLNSDVVPAGLYRIAVVLCRCGYTQQKAAQTLTWKTPAEALDDLLSLSCRAMLRRPSEHSDCTTEEAEDAGHLPDDKD
jgi:hypothetical protein